MIAKDKFNMGFFSEIFRNLFVKTTNFSPSSESYVLNKYSIISQWSDTGPSWPSCLAPLALGQRAYFIICCPLSVVRVSVRALTFSLNIFLSETAYRILMKFHRNFPAMVLFRISSKNLTPSKTLVAVATKLNFFFKSLKIFLSQGLELPNLACSFT